MFKRACLGVCLSLILLAGQASAAAIHGKGPRTQAAMDAQVVESGTDRVQVLTQLCTKPSRITGCSPISHPLRRAIEQAIARPITWVANRPADRPEFWVFAPVEFGRGTAVAEYAWWKPNASACRGGGEVHFERDHGAWRSVLGIGWAIACR